LTEGHHKRKYPIRKLRIKKLRGKPHVETWVRFQIETGEGIVFLVNEKKRAADELWCVLAVWLFQKSEPVRYVLFDVLQLRSVVKK